ncbi:MAG: aminopeptidase [Capsulimonadaceae bacterium]|nr:aminopeptidase [Capsulimonadaceae bacterium]
MKDPRHAKLADILVGYSCHVEPGENVLIEAYDVPDEIVEALVARISAAGANPFVTIKHNAVLRSLYKHATEEQMTAIGELEAARMARMQSYIGVRGALNSSEHADVPDEKMQLYRKLWWNPVHSELRVKKTKWVVLRWPTPSFAQQAGKSTEAFEDFYFDVCTFNYALLEHAVEPLRKLMNATDKVHITGPGTDLRFSIKDIPAIPCTGERNIPDGECFTAPVRDSVNGPIQFNAPTIYQGAVFENVHLVYKNGKIVEATAGDMTGKLNQILDSDEGARYVGEFSLGLNPFILEPMKDILFDEKIAGSFHFTPGQAYDEADNGNRSVVHWDMVMLQRAEQGGGEISFDGKLIRKDGLFVIEELKQLNPENLIKLA